MFRAARPLTRTALRHARTYSAPAAPKATPAVPGPVSRDLTSGQTLLLTVAACAALAASTLAAIEIRASRVHPSEALEAEKEVIEEAVEAVEEAIHKAEESVEAAADKAVHAIEDTIKETRNDIADLIAAAEAALSKYSK